jgi:glycerophosphoryl diester phosphodiesterase
MSTARPTARNPLIIGHRGASGRLPENTLAAFRAAFEAGAQGIELDVRLSSDGVPVVLHDATTTRTTGIRARVSERSAAELAEMRALSPSTVRRRASIHPVPLTVPSDLGVPTLEAALDLAEHWKALVYVELKASVYTRLELESAVAAVVARRRCFERTIVLSFNHASLRRIKGIEPRLRTAATIAPTIRAPRPAPRRVVDIVTRSSAGEAALHVSLATIRRVEALRARGLRVSVWTVNSTLVGRLVSRLGVDALMTDYPERFVSGVRG